MAKVIEHLDAHYEVQDVNMGKVYKWRPESVVVECDCSQTFTTEDAMVGSCPRCGQEGLYGGGLFSGLAVKDERNRILDVLYGS